MLQTYLHQLEAAAAKPGVRVCSMPIGGRARGQPLLPAPQRRASGLREGRLARPRGDPAAGRRQDAGGRSQDRRNGLAARRGRRMGQADPRPAHRQAAAGADPFELEERAGFCRNHIEKLENGVHRPTGLMLLHLGLGAGFRSSELRPRQMTTRDRQKYSGCPIVSAGGSPWTDPLTPEVAEGAGHGAGLCPVLQHGNKTLQEIEEMGTLRWRHHQAMPTDYLRHSRPAARPGLHRAL